MSGKYLFALFTSSRCPAHACPKSGIPQSLRTLLDIELTDIRANNLVAEIHFIRNFILDFPYYPDEICDAVIHSIIKLSLDVSGGFFS
jgi:hypothetical protein